MFTKSPFFIGTRGSQNEVEKLEKFPNDPELLMKVLFKFAYEGLPNLFRFLQMSFPEIIWPILVSPLKERIFFTIWREWIVYYNCQIHIQITANTNTNTNIIWQEWIVYYKCQIQIQIPANTNTNMYHQIQIQIQILENTNTNTIWREWIVYYKYPSCFLFVGNQCTVRDRNTTPRLRSNKSKRNMYLRSNKSKRNI